MAATTPQATDATLRLAAIPGMGAVAIARLTRHFPSAEAFFAAGEAGWRAAAVPRKHWAAVAAAARHDVAALRTEIRRAGAWAIGVFDAAYPAPLKEIYDPPPVLFGRGDIRALEAPCVAVVGSRRATPYGAEHGWRIARGVAEAGFTVVSGLAVGIDGTAHKAALAAGGATVAVLGSGVANVYPGVHTGLAEKITLRGAVISEVAPFLAAEKALFPRRNRIISGLSRAVVVVEARDDSGSLITARQALEQGREVFIVPGPAGGPNRGGHRLLADGANFAEDADDIVRVLQPIVGQAPGAPAQAAEAAGEAIAVPDAHLPVWQALGAEPTHVDHLIERTGLRSSEVLGILLQLELCGRVKQQSGKFFVRSK